MCPGMTVQQHERGPDAVVPDTQRHLSDIDELDLEPLEEAHAARLPRIAELQTDGVFPRARPGRALRRAS
jgi:hypothetical protein